MPLYNPLDSTAIVDGTITTSDISTSSFDARYALVGAPFGFPYTLDVGAIRFAGTDILAVQAANACHYLRVISSGDISKIGVYVNTASGNISVAVYSNSGTGRSAVPGTRTATSGAVACPASGYREISLGGTVTVNAGDWFSLSADNTTAKFNSLLSSGGDADLGLGRQFRQATAHPSPSPVGTLVATAGYTFAMVGVA